ncbi:hypothetical protein DPMN_185072 [Dreissena polymorpha]|uniref:Uncharacterized protein n=1 Tax=Dreissena polymorpha TaxID=45954 RepID=A0A9D4DLH3_DREPO|nr:hypothetical protein DPMN_185072 [Dreissena polymorpha]
MLAEACALWLDLLANDDLQPHHKRVSQRFNQAMTTSHFLANAVHPVNSGQKLTPSHHSVVQ